MGSGLTGPLFSRRSRAPGAGDIFQPVAGVDDDDAVVGANEALVDRCCQSGVGGGTGRFGKHARAARQGRNGGQDLVVADA